MHSALVVCELEMRTLLVDRPNSDLFPSSHMYIRSSVDAERTRGPVCIFQLEVVRYDIETIGLSESNDRLTPDFKTLLLLDILGGADEVSRKKQKSERKRQDRRTC